VISPVMKITHVSAMLNVCVATEMCESQRIAFHVHVVPW